MGRHRLFRLAATGAAALLSILGLTTCGGYGGDATYTPPASNTNPIYFPASQPGLYGQVNAACTGGGNVTTQTLLAWGGAPLSGYSWTLANGSTYPPGTTVDPLTGIFHATGGGLVAGNYYFTMQASDGSHYAAATFNCVINTDTSGVCGVVPFEQSNASNIQLPDAKTGRGYGACLYSDGNGALPYTWSVASGQLPPGLVLDQARGVVRGTPFSSDAGNAYTFSVSIHDTNGQSALAGASYTIGVPN